MAEACAAYDSERSPDEAALPLLSSAAVRSGVERGDPFAVLADRAMARSVDAGESVSVALVPFLAARANESIPHDLHGPHTQILPVVPESDGQDADAMEHERQSRLFRWQRLP